MTKDLDAGTSFIVLASSNDDEVILDPFVGSGTTAEAAMISGRKFIVCDNSSEAIDVMKKRFEGSKVEFV